MGMDEKHVTIDGKRVSGGIFDFALFLFHNAKEQIARGAGPFFYLPKMESHLEARLWNDVFTYAQQALGIPHGSIRATVLIETILAALEMEEILYELRDHAAGLNAGRWDYIFSAIKKAQRIRQARGELNLAVTVDAQGNATKVEDRGGVYDVQMTEIAQQVLLLTKFKPAKCSGQPCTMQFRFTQKLRAG